MLPSSGLDWQSSLENQPTCIANHQWNATQNNFLRLALQPVVFSDIELAKVYYAGIDVV
jgi:hypothetical protein